MNSRWALLALAIPAFASDSGKQSNPLKGLDESRLEAIHQSRMEWSRVRVVRPQLGIYRDFRAILHVHAGDSDHTLGTREQVLDAAKKTGVDIVMWTDHDGPKPDAWTGYRQGVLFLSGAEENHELHYGLAGGGVESLRFLSHPEEITNQSSDGLAGMEIYQGRGEPNVHSELTEYLQRALVQPSQWKKISARESHYPDAVYAAGAGAAADSLARYDTEIAKRRFTAIAGNGVHQNQVFNGVIFDRYDVAFRSLTTHVLARELKEDQIRESLHDGHAYVAHDWLCDPNGFSYVASNKFGVYDMGDRVPMLANTQLLARFPIQAHIKLLHNGAVVSETNAAEFTFSPKEEGAYRLEAWLSVAGEERPWIYSNPLYLYQPDSADLAPPPTAIADNVKLLHDLPYTTEKLRNEEEQKLDVYLPSDKTDFPVLFFVPGISWKSGGRAAYVSVGNRFAKAGIGVVIPSYRMAPANPPTAGMEDVAAAFAWTVRHIGDYGGDPKRIFAAGHSAGARLVSLLALDPSYLKKYDLTAEVVRGVISLSGVYDVRQAALFGPDAQSRRAASPLGFVNRNAPPFLITYCENDYPGLPAQAEAFDQALRHDFVASTLRFIPGENHISEVIHLWRDDDPSAREMLKFIGEHSR